MRNTVNRLVCLDANLPELEMLRQGAIAGSQIVELTDVYDGFSQIAEALLGLSRQTGEPVQELHIVSHGSPGCLHLAGAVIDAAALLQYEAVLAVWRDCLAVDADVYLYGCRIGAGAIGHIFVESLSRILGLSVAASATLTGAATLGGHWELDVQTGAVASPLAFTEAVQRDYSSVLLNPVFTLDNLGLASNAPAGLLAINGDASQTENSLQLTSDQTFQRASSYFVTPIELDSRVSFSTSFRFRLGGSLGTNGSDGFTFVLQNSGEGIRALGSDGGNMGYGGITDSLAIRFDTYENEELI